MKINKLKINSYGKLKEREIDLKNGINIIYGKNEAGKSTLIKFIVNSFYGISKNKKGKDISDYDKYKPWIGEEFSGKVEYELDNKNKYEIYRDFNKRNPKIFNENMEDISKDFNIDKNKGNEFFYEQTKIDEELFLSTIAINQNEVKLEDKAQNFLIQKIANLAQTGDDSISFKRVIDRINRRQLDEVGTERSREKPINLITRNIQELQDEKEQLAKYKDFKYEFEEKENNLNDEIFNLENENNFLREIKLLNENEKIENEKIKIKENIKKENIEKINLLDNKINEIKIDNRDVFQKNSEKNIKNKNSKLIKTINIIFILLILINILQFIFVKNNIFKYIFLLTVPTFLIFYLFLRNNENKKIKNKSNKKLILIFFLLLIINILQFIFINNNIKYIFLLTVPTFLIFYFIILNKKNNKIKKEEKDKKLFEEKINLEIINLENEKKLIQNNQNNLEEELNKLKSNFNLKINLEKEKIKKIFLNKIENEEINKLINFKNINVEIENLQNKINNKKIELHTLDLDKKNIEPQLDNLSKIEEELFLNKNKYLDLKKLDRSIEIAKTALENAYEKMKNSVTPRFTQNLSDNISKITEGKYKNVVLNDSEGLLVELENGNYEKASKLSIGTIDQMYLSLRLSMVEELSDEKMPIILDEVFAYYDSNRLKNALKFIIEKFKGHQIIILTCTDREKDILKDIDINFNVVEL